MYLLNAHKHIHFVIAYKQILRSVRLIPLWATIQLIYTDFQDYLK